MVRRRRCATEAGPVPARKPPRGFTKTTIGRARELFARALETPGGLRIETIHAFCGRVLRRFPLEAGIAPGFSELDDQDSSELWDAAFRALGPRVVRGNAELVAAARTPRRPAAAGFDASSVSTHIAASHAR
jgi:ATP-dependent helicase/nuclease subunit A